MRVVEGKKRRLFRGLAGTGKRLKHREAWKSLAAAPLFLVTQREILRAVRALEDLDGCFDSSEAFDQENAVRGIVGDGEVHLGHH